jgi:hypothetical protein
MRNEHVSNMSQWVAQGARVIGAIMFTASGAISYWKEVPRQVEMFMTVIWMIISAVGGEGGREVGKQVERGRSVS